MRTLLHTFSLLLLGIWIGAILFFISVARTAFTVIPGNFADHVIGTHVAGEVVGGTLNTLHYLGLAFGILFVLVSLVLRIRDRWHSFLAPILLVVVMLGLTAYSQFSIIPRMETARASAGGEIAAVPADNPAREIFDRLHRQSTHVEAAILFCGLAAFFLAGRERIALVTVR